MLSSILERKCLGMESKFLNILSTVASFVKSKCQALPPCCTWKTLNREVWLNGKVCFNRVDPTEKSRPPWKVDDICWNFSCWNKPIHLVLNQNFRKFWLNGSRHIVLFLKVNVLMSSLYSDHMSSIWNFRK